MVACRGCQTTSMTLLDVPPRMLVQVGLACRRRPGSGPAAARRSAGSGRGTAGRAEAVLRGRGEDVLAGRGVAVRPEVEPGVVGRPGRVGGGAEVVLDVVGVVALRLQAASADQGGRGGDVQARRACWWTGWSSPTGAPPVSKPLEKMASGTTVSVAVRTPCAGAPVAGRVADRGRRPCRCPGERADRDARASRPVKAVPAPAVGAAVPNQYSPPATPLARPPTSGSTAPLTVRVTLARRASGWRRQRDAGERGRGLVDEVGDRRGRAPVARGVLAVDVDRVVADGKQR